MELELKYKQLLFIILMQNRKIMSLKTSEILKNFSRNYPEPNTYVNEGPLRMKSRKVAFTSRMLHSTRNPETKQNLDQPQSKVPGVRTQNNARIKLPQMFQYSGEGNKKWQMANRGQKKEQSIFDFKTNLKNRILSPKILRISVNSARSKCRSYSANAANRSKSHQQNQHNPEVCKNINSFQFTFGLCERF